MTIKIFIIAGEASGDLLGARLITALHRLSDHPLLFKGIGGSEMQSVGLTSLVPIENLSLMGLLEILPNLRRIKKHIDKTTKAIIDFQPDILITIDSPGFSMAVIKAVMKKLKNKNPPLLVHYVAPTVWAWKPKRVYKYAKYYDLLLCLLPFEPPYFAKAGLKAKFVGHSVIETDWPIVKRKEIDRAYDSVGQEFILLLPGSRRGEVKRHLPIFLYSLQRFEKQVDEKFTPIIATLPHLKPLIKKICEQAGVSPIIIEDKEERKAIMPHAKLALAASGTVSLELALLKIPHIIAYHINPISYRLAKPFIHAPFVNLVNIIHKKMIIPEAIQKDCNQDNLTNLLTKLCNDKQMINQQKQAFKTAITALTADKNMRPSETAAQEILTEFKAKKDI